MTVKSQEWQAEFDKLRVTSWEWQVESVRSRVTILVKSFKLKVESGMLNAFSQELQLKSRMLIVTSYDQLDLQKRICYMIDTYSTRCPYPC